MIQIENVYKAFHQNEILKGVSLAVGEGEIFGLLGPSGVGKTTLVKIITGQIGADRGSVKILKKNVKHLTGEDRRQIGIMMDQFGVYERLSCLDNMKIFADIYRIPYPRVRDTLCRVGLEEAMKLPAQKLSKGMRNRLQIARVFLQNPRIIFLDEPTSGLDPASTETIHKLLLEKKKEGGTIFLTTHDMQEAHQLCDHVALLNEGKMIAYGNPLELCRKYDRQKKLILHLSDGTEEVLPNTKESAERIFCFLRQEQIETIHSMEPDLETLFLELTGKKGKEKCGGI